ncbi:hypothetical protein GSI_03025 [Ganoderma sinense ZZ0214-1]|uniref:Uncharacterized protein n=1 Tax=Ganoderma sinense ZZ0214-1 TaxID=1077348 RepID=A0A2G8SN86_9APHY|nr:hypothetical protein GSI_03025 [Ganoderma sinense ZZ0214-1]
MSSSQPKPAWLTDELADVEEWIDWQDEDQSLGPDQSGSELSFTQPLGSVLVRNSDLGSSPVTSATDESGGTFIVREELPALPLLPKTPGRNKKPAVKDFFSPLALEKMFEPPSPPHQHASLSSASRATAAPPVPSRLSQVHVPPSEPSALEEEDDRPTSAVTFPSEDHDALRAKGPQGQFTFTVPRPSPFNPAGPTPDAQSTPGPGNASRHLNPPPTDPRLRLFQFQYDTFTRDHLSAMVDSIAVNTPSGDGGPTTHSSQRTTPSVLSPVEESSFSRLRSAKRLKLSPASDFSGEKGDGAAIIMRPLSRRDYVGESRNLMDQIRQARDFSTVSTVATARSPPVESVQALDHLVKEPPLREPSFLAVPERGPSKDPSPNGTTSSKRSGYSSLGYRQQAASLMAQIRNDMKGSKRLFSGDTEASHLRNDDVTEASSIVSADLTVPSLRSRNGDSNANARLRRPSEVLSQSRRPSVAASSRVSNVSRGKQHASSSPRLSPRKLSTMRPTHSASPSEDLTREVSEELTRMSISETSRMLSQFPVPPAPRSLPPPVRLVIASTSTAPGSPARPSPGHLAPPTVPAYPSSSLRAGRNDDLTRFVSSSTASGTTLTTGSADSFVKHAGPKQMVQITPSDVGALLADRVGKMVFDRVMMRWVKATALATGEIPEAEACAAMGSVSAGLAVGMGVVRNAEEDQDNESEDPFRDIESLREEESDEHLEDGDGRDHTVDKGDLEKSRIEEVLDEEIEDEEEAELTSFSTDGPSHDFAQDVPIDDAEEDVDMSYTESDVSHDQEEGTGSTIPTATLDLQLDRPGVGIGIGIDDESTAEPAFADTPPRFIIATPCSAPSATPNSPSRINGGPSVVASTPAPRSVLKSASATPMSALKDPNRARMRTPANKSGHRRSVSFSDGKREGPIVGVGRNAPTPDGSVIGEEDSRLASGSRTEDKHSAVLVPSARSKRIAEMLGDLESTGRHSKARDMPMCPLMPRHNQT